MAAIGTNMQTTIGVIIPSSKSVVRHQSPGARQQTHYCRPFTSAIFWPPSKPSITRCNAGFSSADNNVSKSIKKTPRFTRYLDNEDGSQGQSQIGVGEDWILLPDIDPIQTFVSKPIKPIILATGKAIMLYKVEEKIYCSDANSTAYQYPLADANIIQPKGKGGPAVEVKLDGTVYDLSTGKVLSWCPKNNPIRSFLGSLKDKTSPIDLKVYPVKIEKNKVFVKLAA